MEPEEFTSDFSHAFSWDTDKNISLPTDLVGFIYDPDERTDNIEDIDWSLFTYWNHDIARWVKDFNDRPIWVDTAIMRGEQSSEELYFCLAERAVTTETKFVDYMSYAVGHIIRSLSDVSGKPFIAYDALRGIWIQDGLFEFRADTSVEGIVNTVANAYIMYIKRSTRVLEKLCDELAPDPGPKPTGNGNPAGLAVWLTNDAKRKKFYEPVKRMKAFTQRMEEGRVWQVIEKFRANVKETQQNWDTGKDNVHMRWLVLEDCTLDLNLTYRFKTPMVTAHSPEHRSTMMINIKYDPDTDYLTGSEWQKGVRRLLPNDAIREYVQKRYGKALLGRPSEAGKSMLWAFGEGNTGKSTIQEAICGGKGVFEPVSLSDDASVLTTRGSDRGETDRFIAYARGKRFAILSELNQNAQLDAAKVKMMTGNDTIKGTAKYANSVNYVFTASIFMASNHVPRYPKGDVQLIDRIVVIPFKEQMILKSRDPEGWERADEDHRADENWLDKILSSDRERQAIFHWTLRGLIKAAEDGVQVPSEVTQAAEEFTSEADEVSVLVNDMLGLATGSEERPLIKIYTPEEWVSGGFQEKDSLTVEEFRTLAGQRARDLKMVQFHENLDPTTLKAAGRILESKGPKKKKIAMGGKRTGYAYPRVRPVSADVTDSVEQALHGDF